MRKRQWLPVRVSGSRAAMMSSQRTPNSAHSQFYARKRCECQFVAVAVTMVAVVYRHCQLLGNNGFYVRAPEEAGLLVVCGEYTQLAMFVGFCSKSACCANLLCANL